MAIPHFTYPWIEVVNSPLDVCDRADVLAVLNEWKDFAQINEDEVGKRLRERMVVDGRNVLDRDEWQAAGFVYRGVGR